MKKILILLILFLSNNLIAQEEAFHESIHLMLPNLQEIQDKTIFSKDDSSAVTLHTVLDSVGTKFTYKKHRLVGKTINTDTIKKYLRAGFYPLNTNTFRDGNEPIITSLEIYSENFELNESIRIPECNIYINAEECNFKKKSILSTTPLSWQATTKYELVNGSNVKDGLKAGDITIAADKTENINVHANGSDGEGALLPKLDYDYPKLVKNKPKEIHTCQGGTNGFSNEGRSHAYNIYSKGVKGTHYILGAVFTNPDCDKKKKRSGWGYEYEDENITIERDPNFKTKDGWRAIFKDSKRFERFKVTDSKVGNGGKPGKISVFSKETLLYQFQNAIGQIGPYFSRDDNQNNKKLVVTAKNEPSSTILKGPISVKLRKPFCVHKIKNVPKTFGGLDIEYNDCKGLATIEGKDYNAFIKRFKNYTYSRQTIESKEKKPKEKEYHTPYYVIAHKYQSLKYKLMDYKKYSEPEQKKIDEEVKSLEDAFSAWDAYNEKGIPEGPELVEYYNISNLKDKFVFQKEQKNGLALDVFGNLPGYRPTLSFANVLKYQKNNLQTDLELFAYGTQFWQSQEKRKNYIEKIPTLKENLEKSKKNFLDKLNKNKEKLEDFKNKAFTAELRIDSLRLELIKKADELEEKARASAKEEKYWRLGLKGVGLLAGAAATVYGGPEAGKAAYGITDAITGTVMDNVYPDPKKSGQEIVEESFNKFDLAGTYKAMKKGSFKKPSREALDRTDYYLKNNFEYEPLIGPLLKGQDRNFRIPDNHQEYFRQKDRYENEMKTYNQKEKKFNKNVAHVEMVANATKDIASICVSDDYLKKAMNRIVTKSPELTKIRKKITFNARQNAEFLIGFNQELQKTSANKIGLMNTRNNMHQMDRLLTDTEAFYDPIIANSFKSMRDQSLERLKWMEYQLIKVYNYQTLSAYPEKTTNFRKLSSKSIDLTDEKDMKSIKKMYKNSIQNIKSKILTDISKNHKQDQNIKGMGRKIVVQSSPMVKELNQNGLLSIDLYNDLRGEIIRPDQNNIRIIDIDLNNFQFNRPLQSGEQVNLKVTLNTEGVLRKDDDFFLFHDDSNSRDIWEWTITYSPTQRKNIISNSSEPSEAYAEIINEILGKNNNGKGLFTMHPAWTVLHLEMDKEENGNNSEIKLNNLTFNVRCDYEDNIKEKKVLDIRIDPKQASTEVILNSSVVKDTLNHSRYTTVTSGSKIQLKTRSYTDDLEFDYWDIVPSNTSIIKGDRRKPEIEFIVKKKNIRVTPVFREKRNIDKNVDIVSSSLLFSNATKSEFINIYDKPERGAEIVSILTKEDIEAMNPQKIAGNKSFLQILDGYEIHYIKIK